MRILRAPLSWQSHSPSCCEGIRGEAKWALRWVGREKRGKEQKGEWEGSNKVDAKGRESDRGEKGGRTRGSAADDMERRGGELSRVTEIE